MSSTFAPRTIVLSMPIALTAIDKKAFSLHHKLGGSVETDRFNVVERLGMLIILVCGYYDKSG